ncbi:protein mono-ADP-ribosyltransferase PARP4 isoform X2 [Cololabis saira]|uniref:protein mono-ADP-ribosyltransferase PARP4 isoform X2 n=1 Tax=Cololabis saira TaxID=129043 RepID=UPI002AD543D3|nr:protein mono-ADP-ribosyltransferase PARP4 isoform X2 [Cololabis saira]
MAVFENCSVLLELKGLSFKEKKKLKAAVTESGGSISFVINKQCSLVVTGDVSSLSSNRLRSIQKHQTPVVDVAYVHHCVERGVLLPVDKYKLDTSSFSAAPLLCPPRRRSLTPHKESKVLQTDAAADRSGERAAPRGPTLRPETPERAGFDLQKLRIYAETDLDLPPFPDCFQVAKYSVFEQPNSCCVLELQSVAAEEGRHYRVVRTCRHATATEKPAVKDQLVFASTSEEALDVYEALRDSLEASGLQERSSPPPQVLDLGSAPLQQLLLEEKLNTGSLSQEVGVFVELLWAESLGCLGNILRVSLDKLSLNDVSRAEGLLLQTQKQLRAGNQAEASSLLDDVYTLLPHREPCASPPSARFLSQKLDLCQLIRDVLNVNEMNLWTSVPSSLGKHRALRCSIEAVAPDSSEFQDVSRRLHGSPVQIQKIMRVSRGVELQTFKSDLGNIKPLLHSSSSKNFVGILSRGLLLPRVGVEHHGIDRTDVGNLGSGIYFSDAMSTSLKYSKPGGTDGSRLLLVCDVALGKCRDLYRRDLTLTRAPEGHHSVHGVRRTHNTPSDFEDDEYVVYSPDQVKLKYVVQFNVEGDELKDFSPAVNTSAPPGRSCPDQDVSMDDDGVEVVGNPLDDVTAGLLDSSGQKLPLQAVHVKCKLMDLLSQVVIFQKYTNQSSVPIEAKYVFPLDDSAAVCGFEAFINGKHVVGKVKEKEKARKEYKQAIERGHGAYLMDQDAPDVFSISVGNLPPGASVLIKVTYVSELVVRDGSILFSLPGSVAPWQESAALNQTTQVTVEKVCVTDEATSSKEFTLDVSVEMPHEISGLRCITHKVKMKKTECKAVVSVLPDQVLGPDGFQLSISLSEVHLPRMWVEKHPDKDSQACMLVFYPDFEMGSGSAAEEVILLLDTSESMRGGSLQHARRIALQVLRNLGGNCRLNVVLFGTDHTDAFLTARPLVEVRQAAEDFIKRSPPAGGSTELWRPLRALSLLPPSRGVRNLLLLSDGHIQNAAFTLQLLRDGSRHSRLFTCGLSSTANRHMLRALAQAGGGAYEFFDTKTKHNWAEKVVCQVKRMSSPGCSSVSVKWQQFNPTAPPPVQAPRQLHALFNDCHALVYGFVPHCTQATLLGNLSGQELKTVVSTSELQKTSGTFVHKLTARALIRDYEDGNLDTGEADHEGKKAELKSFITELSKEFSILSQFTSFVAVEERDLEQPEDGVTDIPELVLEEDVDFLPYISWTSSQDAEMTSEDESSDDDMDFDLFTPPDAEKSILAQLDCVALAAREEDESSDDDMGFGLFTPPEPDICSRMDFTLNTDGIPTLEGTLSMPNYCPTIRSKCAIMEQSSELDEREFDPFESGDSDSEEDYAVVTTRATEGPPMSNLDIFFQSESSAMKVPLPPPASKVQSSSIPCLSLRPPLPLRVIGSLPPRPPSFMQSSSIPGLSLLPPLPSKIQSSSIRCRSHPLPLPVVGSLPKKMSYNRILSPSPPPPPPPSFMQSSSICGPPPPVQQWLKPLQLSSNGSKILSVEKKLMFQGISPLIRIASSADSGYVPACLSTVSKDDVLEDVNEIVTDSSPAVKLFGSVSLQDIVEGTKADAQALGVGCTFGAHSHPLQSPSSPALPPKDRYRRESEMTLKKRLPHTLKSSFLPRAACLSSERKAAELGLKWTKIFQLQKPEGYWELTAELGELINLNVDIFVNVHLKNKGIHSLGVQAHTHILRMVATLLVLQLMRLENMEEGKLLRTLFCLEEATRLRPKHWQEVKEAVNWVRWADHQYPCICSRLEFGLSWDSSTRQLLGYEGLPPFSSLRGLELQKTGILLRVH